MSKTVLFREGPLNAGTFIAQKFLCLVAAINKSLIPTLCTYLTANSSRCGSAATPLVRESNITSLPPPPDVFFEFCVLGQNWPIHRSSVNSHTHTTMFFGRTYWIELLQPSNSTQVETESHRNVKMTSFWSHCSDVTNDVKVSKILTLLWCHFEVIVRFSWPHQVGVLGSLTRYQELVEFMDDIKQKLWNKIFIWTQVLEDNTEK